MTGVVLVCPEMTGVVLVFPEMTGVVLVFPEMTGHINISSAVQKYRPSPCILQNVIQKDFSVSFSPFMTRNFYIWV